MTQEIPCEHRSAFTAAEADPIARAPGCRDIEPAEAVRRRRFITNAADVLAQAGYREIETPILEPRVLFDRLGASSDVVTKELWDVSEGLVLRPEGTAGVARAFGSQRRVWYVGPMFRRERPQAGRYRQFTQLGVEDFTASGPLASVDAIIAALGCLDGLDNLELAIGSVGCGNCRPQALAALTSWASSQELCELCVGRLASNPLRMLDCKTPTCPSVTTNPPSPLDSLCTACAGEFASVQGLLLVAGIDVTIDRAMVRGLDYYEGIVFEITSPDAPAALAGGGRYGALAGTSGGIGWACGVERVVALLADTDTQRSAIGLAALPGAEATVVSLSAELRTAGRCCIIEGGRSAGAMVRALDRAGCRWAVLIGERDLAAGEVPVKDLEQSERITAPLTAAGILAVTDSM